MTNTIISTSKTVSTSLLPRRPLQKKQNKLGPYNLLQTLGEGEFGKVKLGVHTETGQEVAIKLIKKAANGSGNHINKVEREISVLKTLHHPYIVKLYSVVETEKYIGLILEYASGGELFEYILAHKFLKEEDAKRFFAQLISSVKYMHDRNIVHRDLKLENLLLDKNRNIVVTDFGFANQFNSETDDLMATTCGSPCYAAPELVVNTGLYAGSAVDIWSCGVILYAMLCGFLPFDDDPSNPESDNINQLYRYILSTHVIFPSHVGRDARDLLEKILVTDPAKRCSLEYIIDHPWLTEYHEFLKLDIAQLKSHINEQGKPIVKQSTKERPDLVINTSMSAVVSRRPVGSGATRAGTRSPRISLIGHDRFAPVANDKYKKDLPKTRDADNNKTAAAKTSTFRNFAIRKNYATATTVDSLATPVSPSNRATKFSTFITRKPVPKMDEATNDSGITITNDEPAIVNPEKSLSSPLSGVESKHTNSRALGSLRRNQQRGTDKFLSFFTGAKVSQAPMSASKENGNKVTGSNDDTAAENNDYAVTESQQNQSIESPTVESKDKIYSESDVSTISVSVPSLSLSDDAAAESSNATTSSGNVSANDDPVFVEPHIETTNLETIDENLAESDAASTQKNESPENDTTPSFTLPQQQNQSVASGSIKSTAMSFRDSPSIIQRDKTSHLTMSRNSSRNHHYDIRSIKSNSTAEKEGGTSAQPEASSSTKLHSVSNAVGESGRKAIAAVRRSMYRKRGKPVMQNPQQLDTIPDEDVNVTNKGKPHVSFEPTGKLKESLGNNYTSIFDSSEKKKLKEGSETMSKKSGMKMMGWIKKRSQATPQKTTKVNEPVPSLSKIRKEKVSEYSFVSGSSVVSQKPNNNPSNVEENSQSKQTALVIPDQGSIRKRNRAQSGNDAILKKTLTHSDAEIQIHQGAIDRNALTSQPPALIIKNVLRILRIMGIETKLEGDFLVKCHRQKRRTAQKKQIINQEPSAENRLEPIYGDSSIDNGDEIRFVLEVCRFENLPGLYIVDIRRLKGNAWAYKFLYHKLIDFLYFDKNGYL